MANGTKAANTSMQAKLSIHSTNRMSEFVAHSIVLMVMSKYE